MSEERQVQGFDEFVMSPPIAGGFRMEVKAIDPLKRTVTHKISDDTLDSDGDVIDPMGMELAGFRKNPVVFADHQYDLLSVIGNALNVEQTKDGVFATTKFNEVGLGAAAFQLVEAEIVKAWSVGFRGTKGHPIAAGIDAECPVCLQHKKANTDSPFGLGRHFVGTELREYSLVSIGANPNALNDARSAGIDEVAIKTFFGPEAAVVPAVKNDELKGAAAESTPPAGLYDALLMETRKARIRAAILRSKPQ